MPTFALAAHIPEEHHENHDQHQAGLVAPLLTTEIRVQYSERFRV